MRRGRPRSRARRPRARPSRPTPRTCTSTPSPRQPLGHERRPRTARRARAGASSRSSSVTAAPSVANACASSQPTGPPPITISDGRHVAHLRRVAVGPRVDLGQARRSAGSAARSRPRRRPPCRARRITSPTWTTACPRCARGRGPACTPRSSSHGSCDASSQPCTTSVRRSSAAATSSDPVTASRAPGTRRASASACAGRSSALDGMHAQNEHSPPTSRSSTIATSTSRCAQPPRDHLAGRARAQHHHVDLADLAHAVLPPFQSRNAASSSLSTRGSSPPGSMCPTTRQRHAHLLQVRRAPVAAADVRARTRARSLGRQRALEVAGDELDELAAGDGRRQGVMRRSTPPAPCAPWRARDAGGRVGWSR